MRKETENSVAFKTMTGGTPREVHWDLDSLKANQRVQIERDEEGEFQFYIVSLDEKEVG